MATFSEYTKNRKKKKEDEYTKGQSFADYTATALADNDIAPVKEELTEKEKKAGGWFDSGAFSDGYQLGDISKTILGTLTDINENVTEAVLDATENLIDTTAYGVGAIGGLFSDDFKDDVGEFIAKDLLHAKEVSEAVVKYGTVEGLLNLAANDGDTESASVLGDKSDGTVQSAAHLVGQAALQYVGVPWYVTAGVNSFGSEIESALNEDATYTEAGVSGAITTGAELLTEKLFGAFKFQGKAADDLIFDKFTKNVSSKVVKSLMKFGWDATGEGAEEVLSGAISAVGQKLTYADEKEWGELYTSEEAWDSFIGGAVLGGGGSAIYTTKNVAAGRDAVTGLTENEQTVLDKEVERLVAEAEKDGTKLTNKQKNEIYEKVQEDLKKGYISTDTIESVLGGDTYKSYKDTIDNEDAILKEYEELGKKKNATLAEQSRYAELKEKVKEIESNSKRSQLKSQLSEEVYNSLSRQDGKRIQTDDFLIESYNEKARSGQAFNTDLSKYKGKEKETLQKIMEKGQVNNTRRAHEFWEYAAKVSADRGIGITSTTTEEILKMETEKHGAEYVEKNFKGKIPNGYIMENGDIAINVNSPNARRFILGHEIGHQMENTADYGTLKDLLYAYAESKEGKDTFKKRKANTKQIYGGIKGANADVELTNDLIGEYLYDDADFVYHLSSKNPNLFRKIWNEVKYLYKMATAGSQEQRDLLRIQKTFEKAYRESVKTESKAKGKIDYSLSLVDPVMPTTEGWQRTHTTEEVKEQFPDLWDVSADESEVRNPTQISGTVRSYRKVYEHLKAEGFDGTILDASSGLGYGTRAGIEEYGFDVEDIEPYPDKSYNPKYTDYSTLDKKYDVVISNAVLNVLPQDQRDALVVKMGEMLNDGGRIFINVRGDDVKNASSKVAIDEDLMEYYISQSGSYQKGFTPDELKAYLEDVLGDGFTVEKTKMFGRVSAIVTKNGGVKYSLGYHAGDLGKAESLGSQSGGRDTGHYGTGTYFVGDELQISDSTYGKRPHEKVDFDKYNLYQPKTEKNAGILHEFLKGVNYYYDRDSSLVSTDEEIEAIKEQVDELTYEEMTSETLEQVIDLVSKVAGKYRTNDALWSYLGDVSQGGDGTFYDGDKPMTIQEVAEAIEDKDRAAYKLQQLLDDGYVLRPIWRFQGWNESVAEAANMLGVSEDRARQIIADIKAEIDAANYDYNSKYTADSASTRFMKALGYEGIDVRGIKQYDNTAYGSVIYDLKGEDLARKKEIGTAKFSVSLDKYTEKQYNDFGWARDSDAISKNELDDLYSKVQEKGSLKRFPHSSRGEAIIEVNDKPHTTLGTNNVFVFVTGTKNNPQISKVVRFEAETDTEMEIIKEKLYERGSFSNTYYSFLRQEGLAREYSKKSALTYNEYAQKVRRGSSGTEGNRANGNRGLNRDGARTATETQSNDIAPINEASSTDGVFFDGKNTKWSLSAEQKEYFKDSVVRDENGDLKVMYHGTSKGGHTVFDTFGSNYGLFGQGSYFTDDKSVAESYTKKGKGNNPQVYESYLNITNPMDMDADADIKAWTKAVPDADFSNCVTNEDCYRAMEEYLMDEEYSKWEAAEFATDSIMGMGYDGITHIGGGRFNKADETRHQVYIAFNPEQIKNIDNVKPTDNPDIRYSLSNETDKTYLDAVERGDTDTVQRMVDEAASEAGYKKLFYHGTASGDFTKFASHGKPMWITEHKDYAEVYANTKRGTGYAEDRKVMPLYAKMDNVLDLSQIDTMNRIFQFNAPSESLENLADIVGVNTSELTKICKGTRFEELWELVNTKQFADIARKKGYDAIKENEFGNITYGVLDNTQLKSADAVTYKKNKVIPLSERFNTKNEDIRYSLSNPQTDKDYLDAVNRGDTETAQKIAEDVAKEAGYTIRAYHGTGRADRVGNVFRPDRATSGPMAFFTDNKDIADNYARNKTDTSLAYDTEYDSYYTQFRVNRNGKNISIPELWNHLSFSERNSIKEKAKHIKFDDDYEAIIVDPTAEHGNGAWDAYTLNYHKGNALEALVDTWLDSGDLFNREADFVEVLEHVGISGVEYRNPDARYEKTYDTWLKIRNPFDTDNANQSFYDGLSEWIDNHDMSVYEKESSNADFWDKNNQTPESWLEKLSHDIEEGTTHAWTVIPDFVTDYLKEQGYDGIKDKGGKGGGAGHTVWIPFSSEQVKSAEAVTYDDNGNVIPLSERFNADKKDIRYSLSKEGDAPIRFGDDVPMSDLRIKPTQEDIAPVNETTSSKMEQVEDFAPISEEEANAMQRENLASLSDADVPPEMDAPYYNESEAVAPSDPFAERDIKDVGDRKVKAYMYENPEVKPFFQAEAGVMLGELRDTVKGERWYNDEVYYETNGEAGFGGTSRHTTADIAYLLDNLGYTYDEIEKGLNAIIEDNGKENNACSKRIEFLLNDRLMNGYQDLSGYDIPASQDYINLLNEKQITEYSEEARKKFFESVGASDIAPIATESDIAPTREYEAIKPRPEKLEGEEAQWAKNKMARADKAPTEEQHTAEILDKEPETAKKKSRGWSKFKANFIDKGAVFEDLSLKKKNRKLMAKWNHTLSSESRAQWMIGKGRNGVKSLNAIREEVEKTGLTKQFYEYLYHKHNIDRMNLENRYEDVENKPVFGYDVTAEKSQEIVNQYEFAEPKFKEYAKDVYGYMNYLRKQLVDNGVISQETADLWAEMYPHYVPIRRVGDSGLNINVPLDTGRTGVNAPIKKATGGSRDILPLFDTMAMRTEQTFKAIARNSFGVELKNTLGSTIESNATSLDEMIDSIDKHEELLQKGENGRNPTFTVFENGEKVTFEITEDMYDALKPTGEGLKYTNKVANTVSNVHRGLLTEYNPVFTLTNAIKDVQDVFLNSEHATKTYAKIPSAIKELSTKGKWYTEYMENGGEQNTYFDGKTNTFKAEDEGIKKAIGIPLRAISAVNNFVERAPRLAEYIASRESGASVEEAMLDASRVTTNFAAGGDVTKLLNRNGATFLNASVQGAMQQVRNVREAKANGLKGWVQLATKFAVVGLGSELLNHLLWEDDEEYEELSDYVKQNYYVVAKYGDGQFVRIPKGRAIAVIQDAFEQVGNALTGDDEVDLKSFLELAISNLAPNNPAEDNILAPIIQVARNKTWYGEDLVPTRLQDLPASEQFDESTDSISKWLGEATNTSPIKWNYLFNQYSGGIGDVVLPMLTPEAESGDNSIIGNITAPLKDKFTTNSTMNNQNVSDFYDTMDELTTNAKASTATDEDVLKYKYFNSVNSELGELYGLKREIQNSDLPDDRKYDKVFAIQEQINALARESLNSYNNVYIEDGYASVGDRYYKQNDKGEWQKITDDQLDKQNDVMDELGISASDYWSNKTEYDFAAKYPDRYAVAKSVGGYDSYKTYMSDLYDIKADKDENGKSISGSRKEKVAEYINNLDADYGEKIILFKSEYKADDTYNYEIIEYLNSREDISYEEMVAILKELGFTVSSDGNVTWD